MGVVESMSQQCQDTKPEPPLGEQQYLDQAIDRVCAMLTKKRDIWVNRGDTFENFDLMEDIGISPVQFGLALCKLKLKRFWTRFSCSWDRVHEDMEAEDSMIDLASYAILTLGLLYRERARSMPPQKSLQQKNVESYIPDPVSWRE